MRQRYIIAAALLVAVTALVYGGVERKSVPNIGAFTLKKSIVLYKRDGTQEVRREIYRRASDGSFRIVETDGKTIFMDRGFVQGKGFFSVDYRSKVLWRDATQKPDRPPMPADPAFFTRDAFFVGTETVLGRTTYHLRIPKQDGGVDVDDWYLPETGHVPVKSITYAEAGRVERTADAYWLDFDEPDPTLVRLPDFPAADRAPGK